MIKLTQTDNTELLVNSAHIIKIYREDNISFIVLTNGDEIETETDLTSLHTVLNGSNSF